MPLGPWSVHQVAVLSVYSVKAHVLMRYTTLQASRLSEINPCTYVPYDMNALWGIYLYSRSNSAPNTCVLVWLSQTNNSFTITMRTSPNRKVQKRPKLGNWRMSACNTIEQVERLYSGMLSEIRGRDS